MATTQGSSVLIQVPGGPVSVLQGNSALPAGVYTAMALNSDNSINFPGNVYTNSLATNGFGGNKQEISLSDWRLAGGTATILTGAQVTNTFNNLNTSGSVQGIQSFISTSTLSDSCSMAKDVTLAGYVGGGAPFTVNIVCQNTGGGSLTAATVNCKAWQLTGYIGTLGALMTGGAAGQIGTAQSFPTSTGTLSFVAIPGTAAPVLQNNNRISLEIDASYTNVSGSNSLIIQDISLT